ncbi:MAG: hypothetical protein QGG73_03580 [Candidatus Hydrogenedentes bacterium]|nr:hypothetical protein [Candidatus Hydrogenedentota bacterium]
MARDFVKGERCLRYVESNLLDQRLRVEKGLGFVRPLDSRVARPRFG